MPTLAAIMRQVLHALLPVECAGCGVALGDDPIPFFCRRCWEGITPLHGPVCTRCGHPFSSPVALVYSPTHLCSVCRLRPPSYTHTRSAYPYAPPLRDAITLFKYKGKVALANALGDLMWAAWHDVPDVDLLMPVPLHSARLREREFNQSLLLVDRLNRRLRLPVSHHNLVRQRRTPPQTELTRRQRRQNLRRAFVVLRPDEVAGKRILLVDDVFTTGTTVNECAKTLRKAGAGEVYVLTLARTI
jgi:ComF family protein